MVVGAWGGASFVGAVRVSVPVDSFYPKKGGVESKTAGCNGGRCLVMPCGRIGEWAVSVPPVGQRRLRRSPPALRPRIRWRREWVDNYQLSPSV
eukprot:scaffold7707_cov133-Isochrysis_galbana.AAC.3